MKAETLSNKFRSYCEDETAIKIDFRTHVHIDNQYGNFPMFSWYEAELIIPALYTWAHEYISEHSENYPNFDGFQYNLLMECDKLRMFSLHSRIIDICQDLINHFED